MKRRGLLTCFPDKVWEKKVVVPSRSSPCFEGKSEFMGHFCKVLDMQQMKRGPGDALKMFNAYIYLHQILSRVNTNFIQFFGDAGPGACIKYRVHIRSYSLCADFNEVRHSEITVCFQSETCNTQHAVSGDRSRVFFDLLKRTIRMTTFKVNLRTVTLFAQYESCNSSDVSGVLSC